MPDEKRKMIIKLAESLNENDLKLVILTLDDMLEERDKNKKETM